MENDNQKKKIQNGHVLDSDSSEYPQKYESAGWKVVFIDELDLNCDNWEKVCLNKIDSIGVLQ